MHRFKVLKAYNIASGNNADQEAGIKTIKSIFSQEERIKIRTY